MIRASRRPLSKDVASGSSDPMAISVEPFERQFRDFGEAIRTGRKPLIAGEDGYQALEIGGCSVPIVPHGTKSGVGRIGYAGPQTK